MSKILPEETELLTKLFTLLFGESRRYYLEDYRMGDRVMTVRDQDNGLRFTVEVRHVDPQLSGEIPHPQLSDEIPHPSTYKLTTDYDGKVWCEQHEYHPFPPLLNAPECWSFTLDQLAELLSEHVAQHHALPSTENHG